MRTREQHEHVICHRIEYEQQRNRLIFIKDVFFLVGCDNIKLIIC